MNIILKPEQAQLIQTQIASGKFANPDEVINTALRLLEKLSAEYAQWIEETREKVNVAIAECDRGEQQDGETVVNQLLDRFQKARGSER
jgi:antitoxin ParD1/3/4